MINFIDLLKYSEHWKDPLKDMKSIGSHMINVELMLKVLQIILAFYHSIPAAE